MLRRYTVMGILLALWAVLLVWSAPIEWLLARVAPLWALWLVVVVGVVLGAGTVLLDKLLLAPRKERTPPKRLWLYADLLPLLLFVWMLSLGVTDFSSLHFDDITAPIEQLRLLFIFATFCASTLTRDVFDLQAWRCARERALEQRFRSCG